MPTWSTVIEHLQSSYEAVRVLGDRTLVIDIPFQTAEGVRPEGVFVEHVWFGEPHPHMLKVSSPIARVGEVDLADVAAAIDQRMLGGIALSAGMVYVVNSLPIDNCDLTAVSNVVVVVPLIARSLREEYAR